MLIIENISDKIDLENILKEAFESYNRKYRKPNADSKTLRYQMSRINVFHERITKQHIIRFKK